jgi:hypothetical protein
MPDSELKLYLHLYKKKSISDKYLNTDLDEGIIQFELLNATVPHLNTLWKIGFKFAFLNLSIDLFMFIFLTGVGLLLVVLASVLVRTQL